LIVANLKFKAEKNVLHAATITLSYNRHRTVNDIIIKKTQHVIIYSYK